jgi:hypothetical protein
MKKWTDEEALTNFATMLKRVNVTTEFIETEEGVIIAQVLLAACGDKFFTSAPREFDWPLQHMPMPDAFKESLN